MPLRNIVTIFIVLAVSMICSATSTQSRYARVVAEAIEVVENQALIEVSERDLFKSAMKGMLSDLDDNSNFLSGDDYRSLDEEISQEFAGVGLRVQNNRETGALTVVRPIPNTPAQRAGLRTGDVILEIDGVVTDGLRSTDAVELIRGPIGESVNMMIQREPEDSFSVDILRDRIPVPSVYGDTQNPDGSWKFVLESAPRIGYIRLDKFGDKSADEVQAAIDQINGNVDGIILDLRSNYGGVLDGAIEICNMFLPEDQVIVSTRGRNGQVLERHYSTNTQSVDPGVPIAVMINRRSASASEIVAACLQDHRRAIVVGEQSYGKGTVQNLIPIESGRSFLKLTVASYWRPSNKNIDRTVIDSEEEGEWGVQPSDGYAFELTEEQVNEIDIARLARDLDTPLEFVEDEDSENSSLRIGGEIPDWEAVDSPLKKAIEYIRKSAAARAAA